MDMSNYKMLYKDQVYNVISIMTYVQGMSNIAGEEIREVERIEATYIDEDGRLKIICADASLFRFLRR